jgi:hypothetical protein
MPHATQNHCFECDQLLIAALTASREYHTLLSDLEAAHIRGDSSITFGLQKQVNASVLKRDESISSLHQHRWTHTISGNGRRDESINSSTNV